MAITIPTIKPTLVSLVEICPSVAISLLEGTPDYGVPNGTKSHAQSSNHFFKLHCHAIYK